MLGAFAVLVTTAMPAAGQTFQRTFGTVGEERSEWVDQTSDGGYIICGFQVSDIYVVRLDASGALQWNSRIGAAVGFNIANRVQETGDGGFILAGETSTTPLGFGISLIKLNAAGAIQWRFAYPGTAFAGGTHGQTAVEETSDGGFIVSGRLQGTGNASQAPILIRTDANGNLLWAKYYVDLQYGVNTYASFNDVHEVRIPGAAPGFIAAGHTAMNVFGSRESLLALFDSAGNPIWAKTYGDPQHTDFAFSVDPAANDDFLLSGFAKAIGEGGGTYLLRTDNAGNLLWMRTFRFFNGTNSMEELASGDIILAGNADDQTSPALASLLQTDASGAFLWCQAYGGTGSEQGEAVDPTTDGGFMLAAWTNSFGAGSFDVYAIRTDGSGVSGCNEQPFTPLLGSPQVPVVDVELEPIVLDEFVNLPVTKVDAVTVEEVLCGACVEPPPDMVAWL
ncbi:MAG: hypothetical protein ACYS0D_16180 [Planctomycetota bacterium]|jgi:hypothetical protein